MPVKRDFALQVLAFAGRVDVLAPSDVLDGAVRLTINEYVIYPLAQGFVDFVNGTDLVATALALNETQDVSNRVCCTGPTCRQCRSL